MGGEGSVDREGRECGMGGEGSVDREGRECGMGGEGSVDREGRECGQEGEGVWNGRVMGMLQVQSLIPSNCVIK